ncbi:hypothetical protein AAHC03_04862 [Spirometra sp. Aus1]
MSTADPSIRTHMSQRAAQLAAGEHSEEAWFLVNLFHRTQPREMLRICHNILAGFLELNYEYFDEGWPLTTRLHAASERSLPSMGSMPRRSRLFRRRSGGRVRSRSPNATPDTNTSTRPNYDWLDTECAETAAEGHEQERGRTDSCVTIPSLRPDTEQSILTTPKRQPKFGWLRGRATQGRCGPDLLPSKPLLSTPGSNVASPARTSIEQVLRIARSPAHSLARSRRKSKENEFLWEDCAHPTSSLPRESSDATLCRYIIDFMLSNPELTEVEGLFRRPGSIVRTKTLYSQLKECVLTGYLRVCQPTPNSLPENEWDDDDECGSSQSQKISQRRKDAYSLLAAAPVYDLTSLLLRCLASSTSNHPSEGLIPTEATDLFVQTTQLQYRLVDRRPVYRLHRNEDWVHLLCHGRQLLAYRIIVQLLLPPQERQLLLKLLSLLHRIAANGGKSKMYAEALARCLALAVFGSPQTTLKWSQSENASTQMGWYIDTLVNLIELYEDLETLPALVYQEVRANLRSKLGHSPLRPVNGNGHRVDCAVLKRSWATCKLPCDLANMDKKGVLQRFEAAIPPDGQQMRTKDNRSFLLTHLCGWSRSPDGEVLGLPPSTRSANDADVAEAQRLMQVAPSSREGSRKITSPFIVWKKKRNAAKFKRLVDGVLTEEESSALLTRARPTDPLPEQ